MLLSKIRVLLSPPLPGGIRRHHDGRCALVPVQVHHSFTISQRMLPGRVFSKQGNPDRDFGSAEQELLPNSKIVGEFTPLICEYRLIYYRVLVVIKWFQKLASLPQITELPNLTEEGNSHLDDLIHNFSLEDALQIKDFEKTEGDSATAVELFLRGKCQSHSELSKVLNYFCFGCSNEDVNILARGLMLKDAIHSVVLPAMDDLIQTLSDKTKDHEHASILARISGQLYSPATLGLLTVGELTRIKEQLSKEDIHGSFAASGNYAGLLFVYPDVKWLRVTGDFVKSFGLAFSPYLKQIHIAHMERPFFLILKFNNELHYLCRYYYNQISTAIVHLNPEIIEETPEVVSEVLGIIDDLAYANEVLSALATMLTSYSQGVWTYSHVLKNMGVGIGHSLLAYKNLRERIEKLEPYIGAKSMGDSVDLTGDGGVIKTIVRKSAPHAVAPTDDFPLVEVRYEGTLGDTGEVFNTTYEDNAILSFELGKGSVIKALDIAVKTMKVGEIAIVTCKPEYAYGSAGSPPDISPDAMLIFEVELVTCKPPRGSPE